MTHKLSLESYDYDLPQGLVAQYPSASRGKDRLLCVSEDSLRHQEFGDISMQLSPGDLIVLNNTKVIKARLRGTKDSGGTCEILVERIIENTNGLEANCQVRVSKSLREGRYLLVGGKKIMSMGRVDEFYRLKFPIKVIDFLETYGEMPIPPYLERGEIEIDESRYQTIYSKHHGAVAAPTAGLHITETLLDQLQEKGIQIAELTLHVGAGTFQPVRAENIGGHVMHKEMYEIPEETASLIRSTKQTGARVVAIGTTVVRALESAAQNDVFEGACLSGETSLFIKPGFQFKVVDSLVTNFHLPKSSLLIMVCTFAGYDRVMKAYRSAIKERYQFFSYGDAMWLDKDPCMN